MEESANQAVLELPQYRLTSAKTPARPACESDRENQSSGAFSQVRSSSRRVSPQAQETIHREHQKWTRTLATALSDYLCRGAEVELTMCQDCAWSEALADVAPCSRFTVFRFSGLPGLCVLQVTPELASTLAAVLLGGTELPSGPASMGDIETTLVDQATERLLETWGAAFVAGSTLEIVAHETDAAYLTITRAQESVLTFQLEVAAASSGGFLRLFFPETTVQALGKTPPPPKAPEKAVPPANPVLWNPALDNVRLPIVVQWPQREFRASAVTALSIGDVLEWEPFSAGQVQVRLSQQPRFLGRLGTCQGRWAVEITRKCE